MNGLSIKEGFALDKCSFMKYGDVNHLINVGAAQKVQKQQSTINRKHMCLNLESLFDKVKRVFLRILQNF